MNRRDMLSSVGIMAGIFYAEPHFAETLPDGLSDEQLDGALRYLAGLELRPGEAVKVLASLKSNRFATKIDPTVQPQSDFDPEVEIE